MPTCLHVEPRFAASMQDACTKREGHMNGLADETPMFTSEL